MSSSDTETVLVVGSTGNIGVAAVKGALNSKRNVLAIVRNQASADKLIRHVGSSQGITFAEADISSDTGVQSFVEKVREGQLPAFQHVYSCGQSRSTRFHPHMSANQFLSPFSRRRIRFHSPYGNHNGTTTLQLQHCL